MFRCVTLFHVRFRYDKMSSYITLRLLRYVTLHCFALLQVMQHYVTILGALHFINFTGFE